MSHENQQSSAPTRTRPHVIPIRAQVNQANAVRPRTPKPKTLSTMKLDLASVCNIACDYCFVDEGRVLPGPKLMPLNTVKEAISWFTAESTAESSIVVLFGGEPLLNAGGVKWICEAISVLRSSGRDIRLQIITNATLVTPNIAHQLALADATVMVSIDGSEQTHDVHRVDHTGSATYARTIRGLRLLQEFIPSERIWARATMSPGVSQVHYFDELVSLGITNVSMGYVDDALPDGMSIVQYKSELNEVLHRMVKAARDGSPIRVHPVSTYLSLVYGEVGRAETWPQYDCGAATRIVSVTPDGTVFPCEHAVIARNEVDWSIGSVAHGVDTARVSKFLNETSKTHTGCSTCGSSAMCDHGCRVDYTLADQRSDCHAEDAALFALWSEVRSLYTKLAEEEPSVLMRMVDERLHSFIRAN